MTNHDDSIRREREQADRGWAAVLALWRVCGKPACRRKQACCAGNIQRCFDTNYARLPEGVRAWFEGVGMAQREGLSFDDAIEWLETTPAGAAFAAWAPESVRMLAENIERHAAFRSEV